MARAKAKELKPLVPLKHEFYASLDNFIHQAGMLHDIAKQLVSMDVIKNEGVKDMVRERVAAFEAARFGAD